MGRYTRNEDRQRLVEAVVNQGMTIKQAAALFKIKYSTAHLIYNTWSKEARFDRKQKPGAAIKFGAQFQETILRLLQENPALTLKQCQNYFRERPDEFANKVPSIGTINNVLVKNNITLKDLRKVPKGRNTPETIRIRKLYALRWLEIEGSTHFVYLDEFGSNINLRRGKGRSRVGTRATVEVSSSRGRNLSVGAAVDINGPIYHKRQLLPNNTERFISFLSELIKRLPSVESKDIVLVQMDNVSFHKSYETKLWMEQQGIKCMYLTPYSPMLNPIEYCFSKVVGYIKAAQVNTSATLFESIDRGFASLTASDCAGYFRKSNSYFNLCLTEQKIICDDEVDEEFEVEIEEHYEVDELVCDISH